MAVARAPRRLLLREALQPAAPARKGLPEKDQRADLRVVERPQRSALVTTAFVVVALFAVFFALVIFHTVMLENQQRLDQLDDQVSESQSRYEHLRLEVAQLEAPQRVVDAATQKLGMVPAGSTTYLTPSPTDTAATQAATSTTTPAPADANDAAPSADVPGDPASAGDNEWPRVKPYIGSTPR